MARIDPALVLATGDLTHRGRRAEHEAAARFLRSLGAPLLVVPGNHDIPFLPPARFSRTWREFKREWQTTEPVFASGGLHVVGLNSVRPWRHQSGAIRDGRWGITVHTERSEAGSGSTARVSSQKRRSRFCAARVR